MKITALITIILLNFSCSTQKEISTNPYVMWVKGIRADCTGVGPMKCLLVQKGEIPKPGKWEYFYSNIDGFRFQNGSRTKLLINELQLEDSQVPADGSSIKYKLIEVLEKIPEPIFALHDIWALESINGEPVTIPVDNSGLTTPSIEININEMKIMGTDGCNQFFGPIKNVDEKTIEFGEMGSTKKMCVNMQIPNRFNQALLNSAQYQRNENILIFSDGSDKELLRFKKVD